MPAVRSWIAKPSSKLLEEKAPEGTVTDPSTVTTLPSGMLRASAIEIGLGEEVRSATTGEAALARLAARRPPDNRTHTGFLGEDTLIGSSSWPLRPFVHGQSRTI